MTGKGAAHADVDDINLGTVLRALSDDHRRAVVVELAADDSDGERTCNSFDLPISKQTQTHHFRILREAGLIWEINYGNRKGIRLRRADIDRRLPGLLDLLAAESEANALAEAPLTSGAGPRTPSPREPRTTA